MSDKTGPPVYGQGNEPYIQPKKVFDLTPTPSEQLQELIIPKELELLTAHCKVIRKEKLEYIKSTNLDLFNQIVSLESDFETFQQLWDKYQNAYDKLNANHENE